MNVMNAIESPRIHHQLMPNVVDIEDDYPLSEIEFLRSLGHNVTTFNRIMPKSEIQVVMRKADGYVYASSDSRKQAAIAAGYDLVAPTEP
jgi:gamma-glutamyltranspeptidase/glutathione hydrolase/leukotriene-C4 hydrolase